MNKSIKVTLIILVYICLCTSCNQATEVSTENQVFEKEAVFIEDRDSYFEVEINFDCGLSREEVASQYIDAIFEVIPEYEELIDSFIDELIFNDNYYENIINLHLPNIMQSVEKEYLDELNGLTTGLIDEDIKGDGKLSKNELLVLNFIPDIVRGSQCSVVSVYGDYSETKNNIIGRNLDWIGGSNNQLPKIQAVIRIKTEGNEICSIGYLGYMGIISGYSDKGIFAGILDSATGGSFTSIGKNSYPMDLRKALETGDSIDEVAEFMLDEEKDYTFNHNIVIGDEETTKIVENNISVIGNRGVRTSDSELNENIEWNYTNAIASVNSFLLEGNYDNHTKEKYNYKRWDNISIELEKKGEQVSAEQIKEIMTYYEGSPGYFEDGDIFVKMTQQSMIIQPAINKAEVFFYPRDYNGVFSEPEFIEIELIKEN